MPSASWIILAAVVAGNGLLDKVGHGYASLNLSHTRYSILNPNYSAVESGMARSVMALAINGSLVMPSLRMPGPGQAALEHDRSQPRAARAREDRATPRG